MNGWDDGAGLGFGTKLGEIVLTLLIDGTVGGVGFDVDEPVAFDIKNENVAGLASGCEFYS